MPQAVTQDSRGTVFGQPLSLESDGMEELPFASKRNEIAGKTVGLKTIFGLMAACSRQEL